jgi:long-chain acyl-CoA synthetase
MKAETLGEFLEQSAAQFGPNEIFGTRLGPAHWKWIHYRDFKKMVDAVRGALADAGIKKGDRVALISNNRVEWATAAFAVFGLGAVLVPMYEAQAASEWEFILADSSTRLVFAATTEIYEKVTEMRSRLKTLDRVISFELAPPHPDSYESFLERGESHPTPLGQVEAQDQAGQLYTSGTMGAPKGVQLSHRNFMSNVYASCTRFDFGPGDRSLAFLPWAHAFGQTAELYTFIYFGAALAINDQVPNLVGNMSEVRPTILVAVPRIFNRIYDGVNKQMTEKPALIRALFRAGLAAATRKRRGEALGLKERLALGLADKLIFAKVRAKFGGRLRFVVSGSAALNPDVGEFIDALGIDVYEGYGLTETSPVVSVNYAGNRRRKSVGKALPGVEIRIDKSATNDADNGEVIVSGPNVMMGYYNRPADNAAVLLPDGSFRTGDMGYLDAEGYLYITGRIKEQYKLENGKYVVPSPLEEELKLSPFISNVVLYGENKPYNVALVVVDAVAAQEWAKERGKSPEQAILDPEFKAQIMTEIQSHSKSFKGYERPKDVLLTLEEFTTENNMLTPKLSVRKRNVFEKYGAALEALYKN